MPIRSESLGSLRHWLATHWVWLAVPGIVPIWLAMPWLIQWAMRLYGDREILKDAGLFGDQFGSVNALFTGVGLIAVWLTLRQQSKQIQQVADEQTRSERRHNEAMLQERAFRLLDKRDELEARFAWSGPRGFKSYVGAEAVSYLSLLLFVGLHSDELSASDIVRDCVEQDELASCPSGPALTYEQFAARYEFLFGPVWRIERHDYLRVLSAIATLAHECQLSGNSEIPRILFAALPASSINLLELQSLISPKLAAALAALDWRSGFKHRFLELRPPASKESRSSPNQP